MGPFGIGSGAGGCGGCSGDGRGRIGGTHTVRSPRICGWTEAEIARGAGCQATVSGRLPPEVIQRVVQSNFGRFRLCYERGLHRDPSLAGRVTTRFVIARDGTVSVALDAGSDLADPDVVSCVVRAFEALAFPEPAGGTVAVIYPLTFSAW
jgi:hypothetical protein